MVSTITARYNYNYHNYCTRKWRSAKYETVTCKLKILQLFDLGWTVEWITHEIYHYKNKRSLKFQGAICNVPFKMRCIQFVLHLSKYEQMPALFIDLQNTYSWSQLNVDPCPLLSYVQIWKMDNCLAVEIYTETSVCEQ